MKAHTVQAPGRRPGAYSWALYGLLLVSLAAPGYTHLVEPIGTIDYLPIAPLVDYDTLKLQRSQQQYYDLQNELAKQQILQLQQMQLKQQMQLQQYPATRVPWK